MKWENVALQTAAVFGFLVVLIIPAVLATYALSEIGVLPFTVDTWWSVWGLLGAVGFAVRAARILDLPKEK